MTDETPTPSESELEEQIRRLISSSHELGIREAIRRELGGWTHAERRILYLTAAGTLAANLLTVVVVAVAVVLDRAVSTKAGGQAAGQIAVYLSSASLALTIVLCIWSARDRAKRYKILLAGIMVIPSFLGLMALLVWLGTAAGIR